MLKSTNATGGLALGLGLDFGIGMLATVAGGNQLETRVNRHVNAVAVVVLIEVFETSKSVRGVAIGVTRRATASIADRIVSTNRVSI